MRRALGGSIKWGRHGPGGTGAPRAPRWRARPERGLSHGLASGSSVLNPSFHVPPRRPAVAARGVLAIAQCSGAPLVRSRTKALEGIKGWAAAVHAAGGADIPARLIAARALGDCDCVFFRRPRSRSSRRRPPRRRRRSATCRLRAAYVPPIICYVPLRADLEEFGTGSLLIRNVAARSK